MAFQKGNKLGKGGKRPGAGRKRPEVRDLHTRLFTKTLAESAAKVLKDKLDEGDLDAAKYVADRMFGKPRQQVDLEAAGELTLVVEYVRGGTQTPGP